MTKEELLQDERIFSAANGDVSYIPLHSLDKFFSQNVVIPKGENRHPYADILHEKLENMDLRLESTRFSAGFTKDDCIVVEGKGVYILEYRIKPKEPVYEWQWLYKAMSYDDWNLSKYMTDDEANLFSYKYKIKSEETKRERKQ